jgi:transcriptional regulator with PAS, ATPase and Fis domain
MRSSRDLPVVAPPDASLLSLVGRALAPCSAPALVVTPDGRVAAATAGAQRLLGGGLAGRSVRDLVGMSWRELELVAREADSDLVVELARPAAGRPSAGWRLRPELLVRDDGSPLALVAYLDEPVEGARPAVVGRRQRPHGAEFADLFGEDAAVTATKKVAERFARTRLPILLLAETGTGKDLLARAIHASSPRHDRPFVAINCGALSPHLLESELFGYAPGAFTDARREGHDGKIGAARGGTLFLDEVAEMPGPLQALLLRVLEDGTYFRVGESVPRQADVRLICATCRDLPAMVEDGSFRRDLFFRVAGACLSLPPVRRRSDVAALIGNVLARLSAQEHPGEPPARISRPALERLAQARWPGNIRQIKTALQYALALADGDEIRLEHLPQLEGPVENRSARSVHPRSADPATEAPSLRLQDLETRLIERAVEDAGGNLALAARRLGIARSTLYRRLAVAR